MRRVPWLIRTILLATVSTMFLAGCGGGAAVGTPVTFEVTIDGNPGDANVAFKSYFPNTLTVHPGDRVLFTPADTGVAHTVTMGRLVDEALDSVAGATGPEADAAILEVLKGNMDRAARLDWKATLPLFGTAAELDNTAANECFIPANGRPPDNERCSVSVMRTRKGKPVFDGLVELYNSGWLETGTTHARGIENPFDVPPPDWFDVTFSQDVPLGTYRFLCLVHFTEMVGSITVVPWGEEGVRTTGSPEEAVAAGEAQRDQIAAQLDAVVTELSTLDADSARAGSGSPDVPLGLVNMFGPKDLSISTGESVTWTVMGIHTISFNAPEDAFNLRLMQIDAVFGGEGIVTNPKAVAPANSPGQTPDATGSPVLIDGGSWDGEGFISSGLIESSWEQVVEYRLTFEKAGTYNLQCLFHPGMEGTVKVGS